MSTVIRASVLGCCMGVRRAIKAAEKALTDYSDCDVYSLGPLIHNRPALESLSSRGLLMLDSPSLKKICAAGKKSRRTVQKDLVVIIRAHGVPPDMRKKLHNAGALVIDATCPRVLANQRRVSDYASEKYKIIIAGDKSHGEVEALFGEAVQAGSQCFVVQNEPEAATLARSEGFSLSKAVLISQTTMGFEEYESIKRILCSAHPGIKIFDTICPATKERQDALKELCKRVDGVIVIGGKNSANTKRLFQSAERLCPRVLHIEGPAEIPDSFLRLPLIGISAGASTPDGVIRDVERHLAKEDGI